VLCERNFFNLRISDNSLLILKPSPFSGIFKRKGKLIEALQEAGYEIQNVKDKP
jgi:hypothetical protein